jgi:hypothetical protein
MKEITRISLASFPYNVEVEAKKDLEVYLVVPSRNLLVPMLMQCVRLRLAS